MNSVDMSDITKPPPGDKIRAPTIQRVATSKRGMISTAHYEATRAGREILEAGGNAVDAAVGAALALGVCEPAASGLGGQTMMLMHLAEPGRTIALDGSSRAPNRATVEALGDPRDGTGYRATTVPSTPATLGHALKQYGTMSLKVVLEPALRLAEHGYRISPLQHRLTRRESKKLAAGTAAPFFLNEGRPVPKGQRFRQPVLAATLRRLAKKGIRDFYTGEIARLIDEDMIRHDGLIRLDDLAQIPRPIERRPLSCRLDAARVLTFPPPGAGRTLVEMVNAYQKLPARLRDIDSPEGAVALALLIRHAFLDRNDRPFDPQHYAQVTNKKMLSRDYAKQIAHSIARTVKTHGETTHLSVMDDRGNVVALTQSIEKVYGSCSVTAELGFLYNNYMGAFEYTQMGHPYYLRPNAVPWASVAPTIVFRGRAPWAAIGSPGSERITPSLLQVLVRLTDSTPLGAVEAPRLFCSIDGRVSLEAERMSPEIPKALEKHGLTVDRREGWAFYLGCVQLVLRERTRFVGVADPRRDGEAAGP
jgi:gamma-glutamyltranspeptidase/glutathione hydrolase